MTPKEYLNQAYYIDRRIKMTIAKAEKMRASITYKSPTFENLGSSSKSTSDILSKAIAKVIDYEHRADELVDLLVEKRVEIENVIQAIPDDAQREILERRYLLFQRWEGRFDERTGEYVKGIIDYMNYSPRAVYKLHGEALKNIVVPKTVQ